MKVVQVLPSLACGDAIGNTVIALDGMLRAAGYDSSVCALGVDPRLPKKTVRPIETMETAKEEDIVLCHVAIGSPINRGLLRWKGHKILIYHNVTPPRYFVQYSAKLTALTKDGLEQVRALAGAVERCIADSAFNAEDLRRMGYTCPIDVCPVFVRFGDYQKPADEELVRRLRADGTTNLLFVGRLAPNKKIEDVIETFYRYKTKYNSRSRLILAGSDAVTNYAERLRAYAKALGVGEDVYFTGHVGFAQILACYRAADVFVCMSEHEGFCVPLLESMALDVPVVACAHAAVPETLGGSGVLLPEHSPALAAGVVDRIVRDGALRRQIVAGQRLRVQDFAEEAVAARWKKIVEGLIG